MTKKLISLALASAVAAAIAAAPASADHAWGVHWARTANPFTVTLGTNLTGSWPAYLTLASADWSLSSVLDTSVVAGAGKKRCGAVSGRVEVCNDRYGFNGWLGLTSVWSSDSHITQATVKPNDSYFNTATYNTPDWRRSAVCHEVGHTLGLDHPSEDPAVDLDTCMDYSSSPNTTPNAHDYAELDEIYEHLDAPPTTSPGPGRGRGKRGLRKLRDDVFVEDLGGGERRFLLVTWTNPRAPHGAPAE
jgi:hypothetical protein